MVLGWTASTSPAPGTSAVTTCISFPPRRPYTSAAHTAVPPLVGRKSSVITCLLISDIHINIDSRSRKALMLGRSTSVGVFVCFVVVLWSLWSFVFFFFFCVVFFRFFSLCC